MVVIDCFLKIGLCQENKKINKKRKPQDTLLKSWSPLFSFLQILGVSFPFVNPRWSPLANHMHIYIRQEVCADISNQVYDLWIILNDERTKESVSFWR